MKLGEQVKRFIRWLNNQSDSCCLLLFYEDYEAELQLHFSFREIIKRFKMQEASCVLLSSDWRRLDRWVSAWGQRGDEQQVQTILTTQKPRGSRGSSILRRLFLSLDWINWTAGKNFLQENLWIYIFYHVWNWVKKVCITNFDHKRLQSCTASARLEDVCVFTHWTHTQRMCVCSVCVHNHSPGKTWKRKFLRGKN